METRDNIRAVRVGGAGRLTLDRPEKLNALTLPMIRAMDAALDAWATDDAVHLVIIDGVGRGLSAGGDIRLLNASAAAHDDYAATFWTEEYRLILKIASYAKPIVALMAGVVMGGGVGISAHARHRIVTESTRIAMPEVAIGLIPDVGGTLLLSRTPGEIGTYLALTGSAIGAGDAIALGLADAFVSHEPLATLEAALTADSRSVPIASLVRRFSTPAPDAILQDHSDSIVRTFAFDTVEEIVAALRADGYAFSQSALATIEARSPTSLKLTLQALRRARGRTSLEECLRLEYRLVRWLLVRHDFAEGSDAAVIGKHRSPQWSPARLDEVPSASLEVAFGSLGDEELRL